MTEKETLKKEARIAEISAQIGEISAMLDGSFMTKHNRNTRKDGTIRISPDLYTFQYCGSDGRRKWKRIPKNAKDSVERLVRAGKRYRSLEREYSALLTELSLADGAKKKD
jgi:hypothetical protein